MDPLQDPRGANERRIARMGVWIDLAETSPAEDHVRFVFYWIAYEAGYQVNREDSDNLRPSFHRRVARHDASGLQKLLIKHRQRITTLLELRQAHPSFWKQWDQDEDVRTREDWEARFRVRARSAVDRLTAAIRRGLSQDVARTVDELFRNLNVVRNQIVHGGSAGIRSRGRTQVRLGAELLKDFVPRFRGAIEHHLDQNWGMPPFPRVGDAADDKCLPPWLSLDTPRPRSQSGVR